MFICQCRAISCSHIKQTSIAYADDVMNHVEFYRRAVEVKEADPRALTAGSATDKKMVCGLCSCDFRSHTDEHNKRAISRAPAVPDSTVPPCQSLPV